VNLDCKETTISGRIIIAHSRAAASENKLKIKLVGSASSFFETMVLKTNTVSSETISDYNLLNNLLLNSTTNSDERFGSFLVSQLRDNDSYAGIDLSIPAAGIPANYLNFCVPITTLLGIND
jgi:hypothetical protein